LADPPTDYVAGGQGWVVPRVLVWTPENRDMNRLFVRSVDRGGQPGAGRDLPVPAGRGTDPIGQWNLDEKSGNVLADASGKGRPATLSGGTSFTDSRVGGGNGAVGFNGGDGQAVTGKR